jgi:hypothetical protein
MRAFLQDLGYGIGVMLKAPIFNAGVIPTGTLVDRSECGCAIRKRRSPRSHQPLMNLKMGERSIGMLQLFLKMA